MVRARTALKLLLVAGLAAGGALPGPVSAAAPTVTQISAGLNSVCALRSDRSVWCWGTNESNEIGVLDRVKRNRPAQVVRNGGAALGEARLIASSTAAANCAVLLDDTVWCWGNRWMSPPSELGARQETTFPHAIAFSAGSDHFCGLTEDHAAWCWGRNETGQVGDGTLTYRKDPVKIIPDGVLAINADRDSTCALRSDGSVWCWGENTEGEVGDGTTTPRLSPVRVQVAGGGLLGGVIWLGDGMGYHRCAVRTDHSVWCWGANGVGQLGDGTTRELQRAVRVKAARRGPALAGARRVTTSFGTSCAVMANRTVRCWGWNEAAQVGDGSVSLKRPFPTAVKRGRGLLRGVQSLSAGSAHVCALATGGSVWCWGSNYDGQGGAGSAATLQPKARQVRFPG